VVLQLPVVTDQAGCEDLLTGFLWSFGLALVPIDEAKNVYEVLSMNGARGREVMMRTSRRTPEQVLARPASKRFVTVVQPLEHTNATIATNALRPFFASYGGNNASQLMLGNVGNSRSMVLSGPQDQVANALLVLQQADVEASEPTPIEQRVEQLAQQLAEQNAELQRRIAELERKLGEKK
ncbi:MAG: hypothetical protein KDC48_02455, partial [Planctomycetes bacterium]|nr:hypothetical protein [Planctomycetota bacterium]